MSNQLPRPRSVLLVLSSLSAIYVLYAMAGPSREQASDGPIAQAKLELSQRINQLDAKGPRPHVHCAEDAASFLAGDIYDEAQNQATPTCQIQMLRTLREVNKQARNQYEAGHNASAFATAMALMHYNSAILGSGSFLDHAVASAATVEAVSLLQRIAARSTSKDSRQRWGAMVRDLRQKDLKSQNIAEAILLGEARSVLNGLAGKGPLSQNDAQEELEEVAVVYATLVPRLASGQSPWSTCTELNGRQAFCRILGETAAKQERIAEEVIQLQAMLAPRPMASH